MDSKPNAIVAQSGGPTAVINSSACGVIQEAMKSGKIGSVIGATNGILGVLKEDLFDISAEKPEAISGQGKVLMPERLGEEASEAVICLSTSARSIGLE